jgi:hypothetical protein
MLFALLAVCLIIPATATAGVRVGVGFYGGYYGPYYGYGYGPYPYYGWGGWGAYPYYGPYGYGGAALGEVHIKSPDANAQIYINGSLAGRAHDLKTIYLAPGTYNVEQRIGPDVQKERIYVLANRSLKLEFGKAGSAPSPAPAPRPQPNPPPPAPGAYSQPPAAPAQPAPAPNPDAGVQNMSVENPGVQR